MTFKLFKGKLRKEAYHLDEVDEPIYVLKPRSNSYELMDESFYQQLLSGSAGY